MLLRCRHAGYKRVYSTNEMRQLRGSVGHAAILLCAMQMDLAQPKPDPHAQRRGQVCGVRIPGIPVGITETHTV